LATVANRWAPRLRDTAHELAGIVAALSSRMDEVASDVEDLAADDQLAAAAPLVTPGGRGAPAHRRDRRRVDRRAAPARDLG
jgi:hypothetical protein